MAKIEKKAHRENASERERDSRIDCTEQKMHVHTETYSPPPPPTLPPLPTPPQKAHNQSKVATCTNACVRVCICAAGTV